MSKNLLVEHQFTLGIVCCVSRTKKIYTSPVTEEIVDQVRPLSGFL
jgi:hypothetical protein